MRKFNTISLQGFQGAPYASAIGLSLPSSLPPTGIAITVDWAVYGASSAKPAIGIAVNLQGGTPRQKLDYIKTVFVDNTASNVPVYVQFPDSGQVISVAPNTSAWYPAVTNGVIANVYALGMATGQIPVTQFIFTNVFVPPYADPEITSVQPLYRATAQIAAGSSIYNTDFGIPALGDTSTRAQLPYSLTPNSVNFVILNAQRYIYITTISCMGYWEQTAAGAGGIMELRGQTGSFALWSFVMSATAAGPAEKAFPIVTGVNLKYDLNQGPLSLWVDGGGQIVRGYAEMFLGFSLNPT